MDAKKKYLTPEEVANALQVHLRTIQRLCRRGEIPALRVGQQWRIDPDFAEHLQKERA